MEQDVFEIVDSEGFSFAEYFDGEQDIIKPRLEALGFTNVRFYNIEADSFGPLIRGVEAKDENGNPVSFYYG